MQPVVATLQFRPVEAQVIVRVYRNPGKDKPIMLTTRRSDDSGNTALVAVALKQIPQHHGEFLVMFRKGKRIRERPDWLAQVIFDRPF
jgi:hypothetical protein